MKQSVAGKKCAACGVDAKVHAGNDPACFKHYQRWKKFGEMEPIHLKLLRTKTPGYNTWRLMISRCHNPKAKDFARYGAKGIRVCDRWRFGENGRDGFLCFHEDMGSQPKGLTLDRRNNAEGYEKSNCRWATAETQQRNKPNSYFGPDVDPKEVCSRHGVNYSSFRVRLSKGETIEQALRTRKERRANV